MVWIESSTIHAVLKCTLLLSEPKYLSVNWLFNWACLIKSTWPSCTFTVWFSCNSAKSFYSDKTSTPDTLLHKRWWYFGLDRNLLDNRWITHNERYSFGSFWVNLSSKQRHKMASAILCFLMTFQSSCSVNFVLPRNEHFCHMFSAIKWWYCQVSSLHFFAQHPTAYVKHT